MGNAGVSSRPHYRTRKRKKGKINILNLSASDAVKTYEVGPEQAAKKNTCSICFEPLKRYDIARSLTCGHRHTAYHTFHAHCIDPWLQKNDSCPLCRISVDVLSQTEAKKKLNLDEMLLDESDEKSVSDDCFLRTLDEFQSITPDIFPDLCGKIGLHGCSVRKTKHSKGYIIRPCGV